MKREAEPSSLAWRCPPKRTWLAADAETFPEPRTKALKAPAKKSAARKAAARKKAAPKAGRTATKKAAPKKAQPKPRPEAKSKPPRKPVKDVPAEPLPEIPAELLAEAARAAKPRKPRGRKAEAVKPAGALDLILAQLDDAKAEQVVTIPLDDKTAVADAMVVASGRSNRHVGAIADQLVQKLKEKGYRDLRIEGMPQCDWVLVDAGDVVVHIFRPEVRSFYNLEKLWSSHAPDDRMAM